MFHTAFLVGVLAIGFGAFAAFNPLLFRIRTGVPHDTHFVYSKHFILDGELERFRSKIPPDDFEGYRNHCLRVMSFAKFHMPEYVYEEYPNAMNIVAMALAYHDVGLWTDGELNYLEPSAKRMESYVEAEGVFDEKQIAIAREIIMQHHKFTDYSSSDKSSKAIDAMVNAVRKGDWADATVGIIRFGLPASLLEAAYAKVPEAGFHAMLAGMGSRLSPHSLVGQLEVLKILRW
jgi:hypothetical protein